ncbi:MAG: CopD family protein, partial [Flavobacteriaceae bacterium]
FFAFVLLYLMPSWLTQDWMLIKLFFVGLLYFYHFKTHRIFRELQQDQFRHTSFFMRIWNEGATLILFAVVFLVVLKSSFHWIFGVLSIFGLAILLMLGIRIYKNFRNEK